MPTRPNSRFEVAAPPGRPLMLFDGDCGFCRLWIRRWHTATGDRIDYATSQDEGARFPEIPAGVFRRTVVLVEPDGVAYTGAEAVARARAHGTRGRWMLAAYERLPGARFAAESTYRFIAGHRTFFSRLTRFMWGPTVAKPSYVMSRNLLLRLMGIVYLIAFVSFWVQIDGLAGSDGILPASHWLDVVRAQTGPERLWRFPTLCWIDASDATLQLLCGAGAALATALALGVCPVICLALLWAAYLSLTTVSGVFLGYQWDNLLLESGFLMLFLAPRRWWCPIRYPRPPSRAGVVLMQWLVFRLYFSSGVVKLSSGDPVWRSLSALSFHYQTQPLPTWTAWYAHQLPASVQALCVASMFLIELGAPFLIVAPRRLRHGGALALLLLQAAIAATGNYGFFNILSAALLLILIDDAAWPARWHPHPGGHPRRAQPGGARRMAGWAVTALAVTIGLLGAMHLVGAFRLSPDWPAPLTRLARSAAPFRTVNGYGLFAVMTTTRHEIIVQGSEDGSTWRDYRFRWKPGDPQRAPGFTTPHMPRLDWQMWFAALGDYRSNPWLGAFLGKLLQGSPAVIGLLDGDPFEGHPPRYVRALVYDYRFTDPSQRRETGAWWIREPLGAYTPVLSLRTPRKH